MDDQPEEEEAHNPVQLVPAEHPVFNQSGDESDISQIMDGIRFSNSPISFEDVNSFEDYNVHVDGLIIDSEIPFHLRSIIMKFINNSQGSTSSSLLSKF